MGVQWVEEEKGRTLTGMESRSPGRSLRLACCSCLDDARRPNLPRADTSLGTVPTFLLSLLFSKIFTSF